MRCIEEVDVIDRLSLGDKTVEQRGRHIPTLIRARTVARGH